MKGRRTIGVVMAEDNGCIGIHDRLSILYQEFSTHHRSASTHASGTIRMRLAQTSCRNQITHNYRHPNANKINQAITSERTNAVPLRPIIPRLAHNTRRIPPPILPSSRRNIIRSLLARAFTAPTSFVRGVGWSCEAA